MKLRMNGLRMRMKENYPVFLFLVATSTLAMGVSSLYSTKKLNKICLIL